MNYVIVFTDDWDSHEESRVFCLRALCLFPEDAQSEDITVAALEAFGEGVKWQYTGNLIEFKPSNRVVYTRKEA